MEHKTSSPHAIPVTHKLDSRMHSPDRQTFAAQWKWWSKTTHEAFHDELTKILTVIVCTIMLGNWTHTACSIKKQPLHLFTIL